MCVTTGFQHLSWTSLERLSEIMLLLILFIVISLWKSESNCFSGFVSCSALMLTYNILFYVFHYQRSFITSMPFHLRSIINFVFHYLNMKFETILEFGHTICAISSSIPHITLIWRLADKIIIIWNDKKMKKKNWHKCWTSFGINVIYIQPT